MGKKTLRKTIVSKGQRPNIAKKNLVKTSEIDKALNLTKEWRAGKNPWITIKNPVHTETAKRFIKVRANSVYGDPKGRREKNRDKSFIDQL